MAFHPTTRELTQSCSLILLTLFIIARNGKNLHVPQQKNEKTKCGSFAQWSITPLLNMRGELGGKDWEERSERKLWLECQINRFNLKKIMS